MPYRCFARKSSRHLLRISLLHYSPPTHQLLGGGRGLQRTTLGGSRRMTPPFLPKSCPQRGPATPYPPHLPNVLFRLARFLRAPSANTVLTFSHFAQHSSKHH